MSVKYLSTLLVLAGCVAVVACGGDERRLTFELSLTSGYDPNNLQNGHKISGIVTVTNIGTSTVTYQFPYQLGYRATNAAGTVMDELPANPDGPVHCVSRACLRKLRYRPVHLRIRASATCRGPSLRQLIRVRSVCQTHRRSQSPPECILSPYCFLVTTARMQPPSQCAPALGRTMSATPSAMLRVRPTLLLPTWEWARRTAVPRSPVDRTDFAQ